VSSPDPNNVNIRIEISVPTGVNVSPGERKTRFATHQHIPLLPPLWIHAGYPAGQANYPKNSDICVHPYSNSSLGSIAISFTYPTAQTAVRAIIYPNVLAHADSYPPIPLAPLGNPSSGNTVWTWDGANALMAADSTNVLQTRGNTLYIWYSADGGETWTLDDTFPFYGYSGPGGPCSGSGSGSGVGGIQLAAETVHIAGFSVLLPQVLIATVTAGTGSFGCLVGVSVPLTYHATQHGSSNGGWFGCTCLAPVGLPGYYLEVSSAGSQAAMNVGAKIVRTPGFPALHSHATPAPFTTGPFLLTCFRIPLTGDGVSPCTGGLTLTITE
jgi:hypothetical protein